MARGRNGEMKRGRTNTVLSRDFGPPCTCAEFAARAGLLGPGIGEPTGTLSPLHVQETRPPRRRASRLAAATALSPRGAANLGAKTRPWLADWAAPVPLSVGWGIHRISSFSLKVALEDQLPPDGLGTQFRGQKSSCTRPRSGQEHPGRARPLGRGVRPPDIFVTHRLLLPAPQACLPMQRGPLSWRHGAPARRSLCTLDRGRKLGHE